MKFIINFLFVYFISAIIGFSLVAADIKAGFYLVPELAAVLGVLLSFAMGGIVPLSLELTIPVMLGKVVVCSIIAGSILTIQGVDK